MLRVGPLAISVAASMVEGAFEGADKMVLRPLALVPVDAAATAGGLVTVANMPSGRCCCWFVIEETNKIHVIQKIGS